MYENTKTFLNNENITQKLQKYILPKQNLNYTFVSQCLS